MRSGYAAVALLLGACPETSLTPCGDLLCPTNKVCAPDGVSCVATTQLEACASQIEGAGCSYPGTLDGVCRGTVCIPAGCGNAVVEPGEACDDGNRISLDGCRSDCASRETCGDGVVDPSLGELCDCGTAGAVPGCMGPNSNLPSAACRLDCRPARCGDGTVDVGEACDDGNTRSFDGCRADCQGRFQKMQSPTGATLFDVWTSGPNDAYVSSSTALYHFDGVAWSLVTLPSTVAGAAIWGSSASDVYAGAGANLVHFDGTTWNQVLLPSGIVVIRDIWGSAADDVYLVGVDGLSGSVILHFNGTIWSVLTACNMVGGARMVTGTSASNVFVMYGLTSRAIRCRFDGTGWLAITGPTNPFAMAGGPAGMFATSTSGAATRWAATDTWTPVGGDGAIAIATVGPTEVVAVGNDGLIVEYDGTQWTYRVSPTEVSLTAVSGTSHDNVFIVGSSGTILH
jgi:cysteine-rich repeat protein